MRIDPDAAVAVPGRIRRQSAAIPVARSGKLSGPSPGRLSNPLAATSPGSRVMPAEIAAIDTPTGQATFARERRERS